MKNYIYKKRNVLLKYLEPKENCIFFSCSNRVAPERFEVNVSSNCQL